MTRADKLLWWMWAVSLLLSLGMLGAFAVITIHFARKFW
jgi:hypothetical protein